MTRIATACLFLAGSMILSQCGAGSAGNIRASSFTPKELVANSRNALHRHYKSNPTLRRNNISRFSPTSVLSRFR
jgi:hypothetical protein